MVQFSGSTSQSDFTFMGRLGVTIQGQPFPHLLYHFVLAFELGSDHAVFQ